ncbi:DUF1697 domain-containing protein [Simiduia litorea]|uniref:DUF1697 domain-containing protein n=1 Tax=Simiduia litorea TaxID=1435348 RepID=UPI0036F1B40E
MKKYVVLLRGVNVGGKNIVPMKALCELLETEQYQQVKTYIQSGNIVLAAARRPDNKIATLIEKQFGFAVEMMVLSDTEFSSAIKKNPFATNEGKTVHFYFCKSSPTLDAMRVQSLAAATERYALVGDVFYLYAPDGIGRSKLAAKVEACLGVAVTARNLNSVNKIADMLNAD